MSSTFEAAFAFLDGCDQLESLDAVSNAFAAAVRPFGIDRFIIAVLPPPGTNPDSFVEINAWPDEWYSRYSLERYFDHDPIGQFALLRNLPFRWRDVPSGLYGERRSRIVMGEAREFGFVDGYCVPMVALSGRRTVVSLSAERSIDLPARDRAAIHVLAVSAYGRLAVLSGGHYPPARLLSPRERDVMTWTAAGKSAWEVSCILGIAERTVKAHLENVRRRLDAVNTLQAVVACIRHGQIQPF